MKITVDFQGFMVKAVMICLWMVSAFMPDGWSQSMDITPRQEADQLAYDFQRTALSDTQLKLFERQTQQKVKDLFDYLWFFSSDSLDPSFKSHVAEQIQSLFLTPKTPVPGLLPFHPSPDTLLDTYLNKLLKAPNDQLQPVQWEIVHIQQKKPFNVQNRAYNGQLSVILNVVREGANAIPKTEKVELLINVILSYQAKSFGKDQLFVWEVFLGELR